MPLAEKKAGTVVNGALMKEELLKNKPANPVRSSSYTKDYQNDGLVSNFTSICQFF
ncbi:MAG: hypothetical protein ABRQ26_09195 [Syntrophomonadaceae bacterium]